MQGVLNIVLLFSFTFWFQQKYAPNSAKLYWLALIAKVVAAISLGLLYRYYYPIGDTWNYFNSATELSQLARDDWFSYSKFLFSIQNVNQVGHLLYIHDRTSLFIKLISLIALFSHDNYWITAIYFALISFFASWYLYRQVILIVPDSIYASALALFFFPSTLLWGSGILKETLALSGLYILSALFLKYVLRLRIHWMEWAFGLGSLIVTWLLKYYWLAVYLAVLSTSLIVTFVRNRFQLKGHSSILIWAFTFALVCLTVSLSHPNFYLQRILGVMVSNHYDFVISSKPENLIVYYELHPSWSNLILNSPWALFSGLFRPLLWEGHGLLTRIASVENLLLLILSITFIVGLRKNSAGGKLFPIIVYSASLCIFLAISTPNFGTLSRYRIGFLPFLVFILAYHNPLFNYFINRGWFSSK